MTLAAAPAVHGPRAMQPREFRRFREWIGAATGIHLTESKQALLVSRLWKRVRELGLPDYGTYLDLVERGGDHEERGRLVNAICTHETQFFREPVQFMHLEQVMIPHWQREAEAGRRARRVRVWSAACSSGEEPYSVAMILLTHLSSAAGWEVEVVATDLSTRILDRARAGVYPLARVESIPRPYLRRFMLKGRGAQAGRAAVAPELRQAVTFRQLNLHDGPFDRLGTFDLILCRNVLIYFTPEGRARVLAALTARLGAAGHLFLGHAETLNGTAHTLRTVIPTIFVAP